MGTRHIQAIKQNQPDTFRFQYLQFDGYPSYQLVKVLKDIMPKILRIRMDWGDPKKNKTAILYRQFLRAYFEYRSFDSGHSIGNSWVGPMKTLEELGKDTWAEYVYVYDPARFTLSVGCVGTKKTIILYLLNENQQKEMGFGAYGLDDEAKLTEFAKQIETRLNSI